MQLPVHMYQVQRYFDSEAAKLLQERSGTGAADNDLKIRDLADASFAKYPLTRHSAMYKKFTPEMLAHKKQMIDKLPSQLKLAAKVALGSLYSKTMEDLPDTSFAFCVREIHKQDDSQLNTITQYRPHRDCKAIGNLVLFTHVQGSSYVFIAVPSNAQTTDGPKTKKIYGHYCGQKGTKYRTWQGKQTKTDQARIKKFEQEFFRGCGNVYRNRSFTVNVYYMEEGSVLSFLAYDLFHGSIIPAQTCPRILDVSYQMVDVR